MRLPRLYVPGGLYYLVGRSMAGNGLFRDAEDYETFKAILARAMTRCRAQLHAFCLEPSSFHLAVTVSEAPTSRLMSFIGRRYVQACHRRRGDRGALLVPHHRALLVDDGYLLELVRFVTWASVRCGCVPTIGRWLHSSHPAYTAELLATPPGDDFAWGFEHGLPGEPRMFGPPALLRRVGLDVRPAVPRRLEDAIRSICLYCGVAEEALRRERALAYARGLAAWYAERRRIATLAQVARCFHCHGSTLRAAIRLHQVRSPELFDVDAIARARPILPLAAMRVAASPPGGGGPGGWRPPPEAARGAPALCIEQWPPQPHARRRRRGTPGE